MTLNLWNMNRWTDRRGAIVRWVEEERPDLLALQEVVRTPDSCQATWIAERVGMTAVFGPATEGDGRQFGNAVLSRLPVVETRSRNLTDGGAGGERRGVLSVDVETRRGLVSFSTTHLAHRYDEGFVREAQVVEIADFLSVPSSGYPVILCGDLNARPDSSEVRFLKGLASLQGRSYHLFDAFEVANPDLPGLTWDNRNPFAAMNSTPDLRIDYILVGVRAEDGGGRVLSAGLTCNEPRDGEWASDHFGVTARLTCVAR